MAKWIIIGALVLFGGIGIAALCKKSPETKKGISSEEVSISETPVVFVSKNSMPAVSSEAPFPQPAKSLKGDFPQIDRIFQLFSKTPSTQLPIVETLSYSSAVPWHKGRPAWIADYAIYYNTSRHFIARSLNGKPDYFTQTVAEKSKFNVFRKDKKIEFRLLVDVSLCKMGFYYIDLDTNERVLLKTYTVALGKPDSRSNSGSLTPLGHFKLGSKVAIYQKDVMGFHQGQQKELIQVFGTRWIPLVAEGEEDGQKVSGYGIHGVPFISKQEGKEIKLVENTDGLGSYSTDGSIRLKTEDMEEIFAIVLTKPTYVDVVKDFHLAKLPGVEVATPSR